MTVRVAEHETFMNIFFDWVAGLVAIFAIIWTLLPLLRHDVWWVRAFDFPRVQLTILSVLVLVFYISLAGWRETGDKVLIAVLSLCIVFQVIRIAKYTPLYPKQLKSAFASSPDEMLSLLVANVLTPNRNVEALLQLIRERDPDIVLAVETDDWWQSHLDTLDAAYPYSGIGLGFGDLKNAKQSEHYFNLALESATKPTIYFKGPTLCFALAAAYDYLNEPFRDDAIHRSLEVCMIHESYQYRRLEHLERSVIAMWKHQIVEPVSTFLDDETVPAITRQDLKRSVWADIKLSPSPLESLLGAWPSEPLTPNVAEELISAVVVALKKTDQIDEAASVQSLLKT